VVQLLEKSRKRTRVKNLLKDFINDDCGQDTIEYVFIGLIVALGATAGMTVLAQSINAEFSKLGGDLT
jgi:Flp pilus assembly pilin Flp